MTDFFAPAGRGVQHANLRAANRRAVLTTIALSAGISNADVSRRTGLAPQTASAIVTELEGEGLINRGNVLRGRRGQPATPLFINEQAGFAIGCEISWKHMAIVLLDLLSNQIDHVLTEYEYPDPTSIIGEAAAIIAAMLAKLTPLQRSRMQAIGLTMPSRLGRLEDEQISPSVHRKAWAELDAARELEAVTGIHTISLIAGNAGSWAELLSQPSPRPSDFIYLYLDTRLETGFIAGQSQWDGPAQNSAHLSAVLGAGLLDRRYSAELASLAALQQRLVAAGIGAPSGCPKIWPWDAWENQAAPWIADAALAMAEIVVNTAAAVETRLVIIDGPLPRPILDRLIAATTAGIETLSGSATPRPRVTAGVRGAPGMALGAGQLALIRRMFARQASDIMG